MKRECRILNHNRNLNLHREARVIMSKISIKIKTPSSWIYPLRSAPFAAHRSPFSP